MTTYHVPGTKIRWKYDGGSQMSDDGGENWYWTFRGLEEFRQMHKTLVPMTGPESVSSDEDSGREIFGETLDEEIPDDLWEMIDSVGGYRVAA